MSPGNLRQKESHIPLSAWSSWRIMAGIAATFTFTTFRPKTCHLEMDAEDLNVANILTSDFTTDQFEFEGKVNGYSSGKRLIYVNQEFRNNHLGHMCLLNLKRLVEPRKVDAAVPLSAASARL